MSWTEYISYHIQFLEYEKLGVEGRGWSISDGYDGFIYWTKTK